MNLGESLSDQLANYILTTNYDDLPENVVSFTKLCILDYFGVALAGVDKQPIEMINELVEEMGGNEQATLITGEKSNVINAALLNASSSHIVELDDIHRGSIIHAATVVIPPAIAVSEWKKLTGKDLITAIVIGYEISYRIGEAVSPSHYYYWHNTATCGTFGAAAATAKLLGLNHEQIVHALGNAGTQAAGLWEFIEDGAMTKQLHPGKAALNGVISSLLGQKGFTGARKILEGNHGFFRAMSENYQEEKITNKLGQEHKIIENSFKIHASCRHTHPAMDLLIQIALENELNYSEIDRVKVFAYQVALDITDNDNPTTEYASKFSLQFCSALALLKKRGDLDAFNQEMLWDDDIRSLMKKTEVYVDDKINENYPEKWGTRVEVYLTNGEVISRETDFPKGDPENPVSSKELVDKFMKLSGSLTKEKQKQLANRILNLESISNIENLLEIMC